MKQRNSEPSGKTGDTLTSSEDVFGALLRTQSARSTSAPAGAIVTGVIAGFADHGRVPLVTYAGQPGTAALAARAMLDLRGKHVGLEVVLAFDDGDARKPIVLGLLHQPDTAGLPATAGTVEMEVDGERMVVTAKNQLVLRCGKATITLTKEGKVLIEGTFVSSRSSGVQRIKGGAIQLN